MGIRRTTAVGLAVFALVAGRGAWAAAEADTDPDRGGPPAAQVYGAVAADGSVEWGAGWTVEHPAPGRYLVRPAGPGTDLARSFELTGWSTPTRVTVVPVEAGAVEIRFGSGEHPVDTRFGFSIVPRS